MKKCLIVVDFQNDFVDGALGFTQAKKLEPIIVNKIEHAISNGIELYFTMDTHDETYLSKEEGKQLPIPHCVKGTHGWQLYGRVSNYLTIARAVLEKATFPSLELGNRLEKEGYDEVELCGLVSYICVLSNAVMAKAALPNAHIKIDPLATMGPNIDLHKKALDVLKGLHVEIISHEK